MLLINQIKMGLEVISLNIIDLKKCATSIKQLKMLCRKSTGEQLKIFDKDTIVLCKYNNRIIGFCCISMESPSKHFENEDNNEIPYLYNYMVDLSQKKKKPSVAIMNYIKDSVKTGNFKKYINLDVLEDNKHAIQFFEKNNFIENGNYQNGINVYKKYTAIVL